MTPALFSFSHAAHTRACGLFELSADHFVGTPNDIADLSSQAGSAQHKDVWDGIGIKQSYLYASSRNIMDKAPDRCVLVQRNQTPFVYNAAWLGPAVCNVSHLCALRNGYQSQGRRNNARRRSLKLSASLPSGAPETKRCAVYVAQAEQGASHGA